MKKDNLFGCKGFTLIELLIAMAITGIVSAAIFTAFQSQQKSYVVQENVAEMQQNLRAGMDMMVREIRMAGYDPQNLGGLGILDVCPRDINNSIDITMTGNGAIRISADFDNDGVSTSNETISFSICDSPIATPDGNPDLARNSGGGRQLLSENIQALCFAYAYDADGDGGLDTSPNGNIIWAVDSDGDNDLDINLDTDDDGDIDAADGPGAGNNGLIGGLAIADVAIDDIRAVRIWMLARAERDDNKFLNTHTYVVGQKVITPNTDADSANDNFRMRLLTTTVKCRNMGL